MGIVALTRELGSLGTNIAERRGYRHIRREILAEAARFGEVNEDADLPPRSPGAQPAV